MAPGACSTGRTWWVAMPRTAHAMGAPNRLFRGAETPHPPRDFLSPPPHRRKEVQIPGPDRSRANRTGHLHVLTILPFIFPLTCAIASVYTPIHINPCSSGRQLPLFCCPVAHFRC